MPIDKRHALLGRGIGQIDLSNGPQDGDVLVWDATERRWVARSPVTTGTWIPADNSGAGLTFTDVSATYTRHGDVMIARCRLVFPATADSNDVEIDGLPVNVANNQAARQGFCSYANVGQAVLVLPIAGNRIRLYDVNGDRLSNADCSGATFYLCCVYAI